MASRIGAAGRGRDRGSGGEPARCGGAGRGTLRTAAPARVASAARDARGARGGLTRRPRRLRLWGGRGRRGRGGRWRHAGGWRRARRTEARRRSPRLEREPARQPARGTPGPAWPSWPGRGERARRRALPPILPRWRSHVRGALSRRCARDPACLRYLPLAGNATRRLLRGRRWRCLSRCLLWRCLSRRLFRLPRACPGTVVHGWACPWCGRAWPWRWGWMRARGRSNRGRSPAPVGGAGASLAGVRGCRSPWLNRSNQLAPAASPWTCARASSSVG